MKKLTLLAGVLALVAVSCNTAEPHIENSGELVERTQIKKIGTYKTLAANDFKNMMEQKPGTVIDLREEEETSYGVIDGAVILPLYADNFEQSLVALEKDKPVYVYDESGSLSSIAAKTFLSNEFQEIYSLVGGITAWGMEGYETVNPKLITGEF
jgi:rhodanese-related sulfurtransferase